VVARRNVSRAHCSQQSDGNWSAPRQIDFERCRRRSMQDVARWRATVDEDGHFCFAVAL
jgi:hypothetical protein